MKELLPLVILLALFVGLILFNRRNRERSARADATRRATLGPGSEVMTTSGLYATVVSVDTATDTTILSIAPGVEVKWAIAALRQVDELPAQYRPRGAVPAEQPASHPEPGSPSGHGR